MRKHRFKLLSDISAQFMLRTKLIFYDRICIMVFFAAIAVFMLMVSHLGVHAETGTYIAVGVINNDTINGSPTDISSELCRGIENTGILRTEYGSYEELEGKMLDGYINSIFIINEGYEENVKSGKVKNLITVVHAGDDKATMFVKDIVVGQMMYDICTYTTIEYYKDFEGEGIEKTSPEKYEKYVAGMFNGIDNPFEFKVNFVGDRAETTDSADIGLSLLYNRMIAGIAAMMYSFVALFVMMQSVGENTGGIRKRRELSFIGNFSVFVANILSSGSLLIILSIAFPASMAGKLNDENAFVKLVLYSVLFCICMTVIFELIARLSKSVIKYQLIGAGVIILFGVAGFCSMVSGVMDINLGVLEELIPNCRFVNAFTELLY